ncbi:MAG TPA: hypothetical protein VFA70_08135, partial [Dehalococcoidia bacterium]|nr:hypothetical protein [Dehalococcoidia bacterium]
FYLLVGQAGYDKTEQAYERLCNHLANARRARRIPWHTIRDDGATVIAPEHFASEDAFYAYVRDLAENYERDKLAGQPLHIEVWCEAAGMQPQLARVAERYSIAVYSCGGFDSLTAKHAIAARICRIGKPAIILHLGDLDPSGVSIFEAAAEDVAAFVAADKPHGLVSVEFRRVALTASQVAEYQLPTAPAKSTDSRTKRWQGETCQLEALPPDTIAGLLEAAILGLPDLGQLEEDEAVEQVERQRLASALPAPRSDSAE